VAQPLWLHQQREVEEHTFESGWFLYWDPRTGKTRPIVYEIAHWIKAGVQRILVVAPRNGCKVWLKEDELGVFAPSRVCIVDLSTDDSIAARATALSALLDFSMPTIVVVNRDVIFKERTTKTGTLTGLQKALLKWGPQALILDECHDYRKISSKRSRAAEALAKRATYRRGLTGTPDPRNYIDYYSQFKIICPEVFGTRKVDFIERYCNMNPYYPNKVESYKNVEELQTKIYSRASRVRQSDCFDMPDVLPDSFVDVPFTRLARNLYDELVENSCAEFLGLQLDATHQLARLAILHQLAAGYVRDGSGNPEWIFDGKIRAALEFIDEMVFADKRIVVFHQGTPEGERLYAECLKKYGAKVTGALNGQTPDRQRSPHPFRDRPNMRIFIAQEDTANISISLRESDHTLWYSWGPKHDIREQARQRIFDERKNKPHGLSYTFLNVPKSVDQFYTKILAKKLSASHALLDGGFRRAAYGDV
jgi:hypothetical protein